MYKDIIGYSGDCSAFIDDELTLYSCSRYLPSVKIS